MTDGDSEPTSGKAVPLTKKMCILCAEEIPERAKVCAHCGSHQRRFLNLVLATSPVVSLVMVLTAVAQVIFASAQLQEARKDRIKSATALDVAERAKEVTRLHEKTITKLTLELNTISTVAHLSATILRAENDDRHAAESLLSRINDKSDPLMQTAANAYNRILGKYSTGLMAPPNTIAWPKNIDPTTLPLTQFKKEYTTASPVYRADIVQRVFQLKTASRHEKMAFLADILKNDVSLDATYYAGKYFAELADDPGLRWSPFTVGPLIEWWTTREAQVTD